LGSFFDGSASAVYGVKSRDWEDEVIGTRRTVYIVNPAAGKGKSLRIWALLEKALTERGQVIETRSGT